MTQTRRSQGSNTELSELGILPLAMEGVPQHLSPCHLGAAAAVAVTGTSTVPGGSEWAS